jgi:N-acetyl-alpha-D-glucosaminyl L-malate synthase BshA
VTTLHGTDVTLVGSDPALQPIHRFTLELCDGLTTPSEYLRRNARQHIGLSSQLPFEVIPNFIDTDRFSPARNPAQRRDILSKVLGKPLSQADSDSLCVLSHSSNFRPVKRIDDLLTMTQTLSDDLPVLLLLIGDGPERERLQKQVRAKGLSSSVRFLGQQKDFVPLLQQSDVFLLPSQMEGFGLSALEALGCGVPVVASNVGGLPEVITDGQTGFLHEVGDVAAITRAVRQLLTNTTRWTQMSHAARHSVEQSFQRDPLVTRYEQLFLSLCRRA